MFVFIIYVLMHVYKLVVYCMDNMLLVDGSPVYQSTKLGRFAGLPANYVWATSSHGQTGQPVYIVCLSGKQSWADRPAFLYSRIAGLRCKLLQQTGLAAWPVCEASQFIKQAYQSSTPACPAGLSTFSPEYLRSLAGCYNGQAG